MYAPFSHSVFEPDVKIEPISFYGCDKSEDPISNEENDNPEPKVEDSEDTSKSKSHICNVCGKILSSTSSYYVHMKSHSGNKPFQCTLCDAAFCRKPYLEVHMRTHTGEKPFQCDICKKRFTQKSSLNTHKRVHTGARPYECDLCNKTFAVKSYLSAHSWSHMTDVSLFCDGCQISFSNKNQFVQHLKRHSNKGFDCKVCGRSFVKESYLIRHAHKLHRNKGEMKEILDDNTLATITRIKGN